MAHYSRKINGRFTEYPLAGGFHFGDDYPCGENECTTEEYLVGVVKRHQLFNIVPEAFWLDARWYEGCGWNRENGGWWQNVGNWTPDQERFPNGLRPVADAIHEAGAKFLLWFEPERVRPQTFIAREHPEWMLQTQSKESWWVDFFNSYLFDLGNKDARLWLTDYISEIIRKEGVDIYRQDFNINPYAYWMDNDPPGRTGISEIRHIEGLYAFWDSLLVRFPNLLIDNCA